MMKRFTVWLVFLLISLLAIGQEKATVTGLVIDAVTGEPIYGVNVVYGEHEGTTTDLDGKFKISLLPGTYTFTFRYLGYQTVRKDLTVEAGKSYTLNIALEEITEELNLVVVSASKYEKNITEETISIDVLQPDLIENTATTNIAQAVDKISSINILDNQVSIRGGSGYAFGAGSRVLVVVDEQPLLTADRADIRINYIPMEIVDQIEVIKGPSSSIYGASALNGIISIRTIWPKSKPQSHIRLYNTVYQKPSPPEQAWWNRKPPFETGIFFSHAQRFGRFDLVTGGAGSTSRGYIKGYDEALGRYDLKMRYRPKKFDRLVLILNHNFQYSKDVDFFYWYGLDSMYVPNRSADLYVGKRIQFFVDPYISFYDRKDNKHVFKARQYMVRIQSSSNKPTANMVTADYMFHKKFQRITNLIAGVNGQYFNMREVRGDDLGNHDGNMAAIYLQVDNELGKWNVDLGFRWEFFRLDNVASRAIPVGRLGVNYEAAKYTNLRLGIGQGYRFPSVAERFVDEDAGSIRVFPNPDILPEYGFQAELGVKQGLKISNWLGYFDFATFWTEFKDMTEFHFGFYPPEGQPVPLDEVFNYLGFRMENVSRARIMGFETSTMGTGKIGILPFRVLAGYTYVYPVDLNVDTTLNSVGKYLKYFFRSFSGDSEVVEPMLKYRFRHVFKGDVEFDVKKATFGIDYRYYSFMEKIDQVFEDFIPGVKQFRQENHHGTNIINLRLAYNFDEYGKISFHVNNLLNVNNTLRPAKPDPPRNFTLQYSINIGS